MSTTEHIHEANIIDEPRPYRGPVASPDFSEPRAHGNIEITERCHCGYHRRVNVNQWFREEGPWVPGPRVLEDRERRRRERLADQLWQRGRETSEGRWVVRLGGDTSLDLAPAGHSARLLHDDAPVAVFDGRRWTETTVGALREAAKQWKGDRESPAGRVYTRIGAALP